MIEVFFGENRAAALEQARKFLGGKYETVEGEELSNEDLTNLFLGNSLFEKERVILIRDFFQNAEVRGEIEKYLETPHKIAILENKISATVMKNLKGKMVFSEFKMPRDFNAGRVFDIYKIAKRDGVQAVMELQKIEQTQDPIMFAGLLNSQAMKDYAASPNAKNKQVLKMLAKLDMELKSSNKDSWVLVESMLLKIK